MGCGFSIVNISSAIFDCSAPDLDSCPDESLPEFAFIGRSNVGKSSLLNMLAGEQGLARVSPTPGFTKLINLFTMNKGWRLVDLPGYGFAHGARKDRARFNLTVNDYLENPTRLVLVFRKQGSRSIIGVTSANRLDENTVGLRERGKVAVRRSRNQLDLQRPTYSVNSRRFTISAGIYRIALKLSSGTRWRHD